MQARDSLHMKLAFFQSPNIYGKCACRCHGGWAGGRASSTLPAHVVSDKQPHARSQHTFRTRPSGLVAQGSLSSPFKSTESLTARSGVIERIGNTRAAHQHCTFESSLHGTYWSTPDLAGHV